MLSHINRLAAPVLAGVGACLIFASPPAAAQNEDLVVRGPSRMDYGDYQMRMERVSYRDLNLATYDGQQKFRQRVGRAVRHVCLTADTRTHGLSQTDHYKCTVGAWRMAWPQMNTAITQAQQVAAAYGR